MKKKVKLEDVNKAGWKVTKTDRKTVAAAKTTITTTKAMNSMAKNSAAGLALTEKLIAAVEDLPNRIVTPAPTIPDPEKKRWKFTINRNQEGFIDTVDVEQI